MRKKYHIYGRFYDWTYNLKIARKLANDWNGIITVEINGVETPL